MTSRSRAKLSLIFVRRGQSRSAHPSSPITCRKISPLPFPPAHSVASFPCNRNGRAIRAAPFADRRPASTSMVLADHVPERHPAGPEAGGAEPVGAVKRLKPKGRRRSEDAARQLQNFHHTDLHPHLPGHSLLPPRQRCCGARASKALWIDGDALLKRCRFCSFASVPISPHGLNRC